MLDELVKYTLLFIVAGTAIATFAAFVVGLIKYVDQRNREERNRTFELYHNLMRSVSAYGSSAGEKVPLTQQMAAIYELQHFASYSYATLPTLRHLREYYKSTNASEAVIKAIDDTLAALETA